jgi:hypothetical protein
MTSSSEAYTGGSLACWYVEPQHRPRFGACPTGCTGPSTHAERVGGGGNEHTAMRTPTGAARPPGSRQWCGAWPSLPPITPPTRTRTALSLVREDQHQTEPESNGPDGS